MTIQQLLQHLKDNLVSYYLHYNNPGVIEFTIGLPSQDNIHFEQLNGNSIHITATLNNQICKTYSIPFNSPEFNLLQEVYQMLRGKLINEAFREHQKTQHKVLQNNTTRLITQL